MRVGGCIFKEGEITYTKGGDGGRRNKKIEVKVNEKKREEMASYYMSCMALNVHLHKVLHFPHFFSLTK